MGHRLASMIYIFIYMHLCIWIDLLAGRGPSGSHATALEDLYSARGVRSLPMSFLEPEMVAIFNMCVGSVFAIVFNVFFVLVCLGGVRRGALLAIFD